MSEPVHIYQTNTCISVRTRQSERVHVGRAHASREGGRRRTLGACPHSRSFFSTRSSSEIPTRSSALTT
eukprot:3537498-Rhodomonas_salina.3